MLKIKDNIDLKELEKFGFREKTNNKYEKGRLFDQYMEIQEDRIIAIYTSDDKGIDEDTLYDLIQAGLVEKVSD